MIQEDYCSYEVSTLLKEKGAIDDIDSWTFLWKDGKHYATISTSVAMKWLRKKGIFVLPDVRTADGKWFCMIVRRFEEVDNGCTGERRAMGYYDACEEAVDAALLYVLENYLI